MEIEYKALSSLLLDPKNDRFAELYSGSEEQDDLIEYLLFTEAAEEVAKNISERGQFYPDAALWVISHGEGFLVKDGNRRCAAVKALQNPKKYGLDLPKMDIEKLPVLIYSDVDELERRIQEQHTHSLFREWDRIAKALKAYDMHKTGSSEDVIKEIDSNPPQLIKLASFYYEAVKIAGEDLKKLLRRGKGHTGGKTIIFERLFSYSNSCGYKFKNKPSYQVELSDSPKFNDYIKALVAYLKDNPDITHKVIDDEKAGFLKKLRDYGFVPGKDKNKTKKGSPKGASSGTQDTGKGGSIKARPTIQRKQVAPKLKRLVDECYDLDGAVFSNAKVALSRVVFESVLKFLLEETKYKNKKLRNYNYFRLAFFDKNGNPRVYTNFTTLKDIFTKLITDTGTMKAFEQFDLERLHQIIHNYKSGAGPHDARTTVENLLPLIEFMLQEETDFIASMDTTKLV